MLRGNNQSTPLPRRRSWGIGTALILAAGSVACLAGEVSTHRTEQKQPAHWSFAPPQPPALPTRTSPKDHPIDTFVRERLLSLGLKPSPEANRHTLIRRLSLDLLGLPPSPAEIQAFVNDSQPDAYDRLVERLLASPHFGEHWGRHWLDLARYADSDGYEKDTARPNAYLYRDWVIAAINRDLPYDQFTVEQLAGDLLPDATDAQRIATGFHRQTLLNKEGGVDQEEYRCKATVDRTHTTGAAWLGLTVGCAECHNHKYDPLTQREFYQLYAFFNRASDSDLPLPTAAEQKAHATAMTKWKAQVAEIEALLARAQPTITNGLVLTTNVSPSTAVASSTGTNRAAILQEKLEKLRKTEPKLKSAAAMVLSADSRATHVHVRGDFLQKGESVEPGTPAFLPALTSRGATPDRLDLARWLVASGNPLTARVAVNHVWRHLFGRGLVVSENDFGLRGDPPSHPGLLDWLALEYQRLGWSRKALIRRIVTSATYRQSSDWRSDLAERDPLNTLLARQGRFRIDAEVVRDTALSVSGLLNPRVGGPSFKPALPPDLANINYANGLKWEPATGNERFRRGLYIHFQRTVPYPMLMAFDAPESTVTCTRRERSNSPLQALTLLNNELFVECARALAEKILPTAPTRDVPSIIRTAFETAIGRPATRAEERRLREFWRQQQDRFAANPAAAREAIGELPPAPANKSVRPETNAIPNAVAVVPTVRSGANESRLTERATSVALARVLLNLDEVISRE